MDVGVHAIEQLILYFGKELFEWLKEKSKKNPKLQILLQENLLKAGNNISLDEIIAAGGCNNVSELLAVQEGKPVPVSPPKSPPNRKRHMHMHDDDCLALRVYIEKEKCDCSLKDNPKKKSDDDDFPTISKLFGQGFKVRREETIDGRPMTWHAAI